MASWQPQDIEEAFDAALAKLRRGEPLDTCLPADAELARELRPLLMVAVRMRALAEEAPATPRLAAGKARVLARAGRLARPQPRLGIRVPQQLAALFAPLLRRGAAATVVLVALLAVLLTGTTMITAASTSSLPGDALYPVKRAAETVHMALTFDQRSRDALSQVIEGRRIQETQAVLERRRQTTVSFQAVVESYTGSQLTAAGLTVQVLPTTRLSGPSPGPGRVVAVTAKTQADGSLAAQRIHTLVATPYPAYWPSVTRTGTATPSPAPSTTASVTPSASDTPTAESSSSPTVGAGEAITGTETPTGTVTPAHESVLHLAGTIESVAPDLWRVAGYDLVVDANTQVQERGSSAQVGAWARVKALREADGRLVASRIVVERPAEEGETVWFAGTIEGVDGAQWTVDGQAVLIGPETRVSGEPQPGAGALVAAWRQQDGALLAQRAAALSEGQQAAELEGTIEEASDGRWVVAGQTVLLDEATLISGQAGTGAEVAILGYAEGGGDVHAAFALVETPPAEPTQPPTATATPVPTATRQPTATVTATPTATVTSTPTATASATETATDTPTVEVEASATPTATATATATSTPKATAKPVSGAQ